MKYITSAIFIAILGGFFILNLLIPTPDVIESERRRPAAFPQFSVKSILDTTFMDGFDSWSQDSFTFREAFRTIRAFNVFYIFRQTDKEGLYRGDTGVGSFQKIDEAAWVNTISRINLMAGYLDDGTIASGGLNMYAAIIPDKSIYAGRFLPGYDPDTARRLIEDGLSSAVKPIELTGALAAGDFYRTDLHWSQPRTEGVLEKLSETMNFQPVGINEEDINIAGLFKGVYAGQIALPITPDDMLYVSNKYIDSAAAFYLDPRTQEKQEDKIYFHEAMTSGGDQYDFFLNGPQPLITLEADQQKTGRTLYLFRDSFGSSLAPLLLGSYDKIILIDLRYIDSRILSEFIEFEPGSDVLFLYSSQIMNNPTTLLVR